MNPRTFRNFLLALALCTACASAIVKPSGETEADTFGKGEVTVEVPVCPADAAPGDTCPMTTVTVESHGISDNFLGAFGGLVQAAQNVFGRSGGTTVVVSPAEPTD